MELPYQESTSSDSNNDFNQTGPEPTSVQGPVEASNYHAPMFRPSNSMSENQNYKHSPPSDSTGKLRTDVGSGPTGTGPVERNHPPSCKSCGKTKIASLSAEMKHASSNGSTDEDTSEQPTHAWKIVLWIVIGVIGLIIVVAIFRCMSGNGEGPEDILSSPLGSLSPPSLFKSSDLLNAKPEIGVKSAS